MILESAEYKGYYIRFERSGGRIFAYAVKTGTDGVDKQEAHGETREDALQHIKNKIDGAERLQKAFENRQGN